MTRTIRFSALRRFGAALVALAGAAATIVTLQPATAATVSLTGGTTASCTYSAVTGTSTGNFIFQCGTAGSPGTLALSSASASVAPNGQVTLSVSRTGGNTGAASATLAGTCALSNTEVTFAADSAMPSPATFTATAPPSGTCTVTMTATGATLGSPNSFLATVVDPNSNVTFAFSAATSTASVGGSPVAITVTRNGGTNGDWLVPVVALSGTLTSGAVLPPSGGSINPIDGVLAFPANSSSATLTYTPPASLPTGVTAPGTINFTLAPPVQSGTPVPSQTASLGTPNVNAMSVQVPAGPCATTATLDLPYYSGSVALGPITAGQSVGVSIPVTAQMLGRLVKATIADTAYTSAAADVQFALSTCPGDFSKPYPCMAHTQYTGGGLNFSIGPKPAGTPWYMGVCELPVGTSTVYFNFRHIKRPTPVPQDAPGTPSCPDSCSNFLQVN